MSLATSNRDGGRTSEAGHLRAIQKGIAGEVLSGLAVSQRAAGANMSVDVAIGDSVIPRSDATYGHPAWNDAVLNKTITAADVSNPRRDIVVLYIDYGQAPSTGVSNNTNGVVKCIVVAGTPAGSPADPSDAALQAAVGASNPYIKLARVRVGAGVTTISNSVIDDLRTMAQALENGGWNALSSAWDSWAYSAWDNTNKLGTVNVPDSSIFTLGQKVRYWQLTGGWKYGFVVRKPNGTSIQLYQGHVNGYTLNNERVYLPAYSRDKAPDGFPIDPAVWTVTFTDSTQRSQGSPVVGTWYNLASQQIAVPVGLWKLSMKVQLQANGSTPLIQGALSTSASSPSHPKLMAYQESSGTVGSTSSNQFADDIVSLTANTPFYLISRAFTGATVSTIYNRNEVVNCYLQAVCAYL
ncbi:MAG: hypothetical protein WC426_13560 [Sulfuriferula sp.]